MHFSSARAALAAVILLFGTIVSLASSAQAADFPAGSRVQGRIGSLWDRCTVIGPRRPTGGYLLRCNSHPDQETVFAASDVRAMQGADLAPVRKHAAVHASTARASSGSGFKAIPPRTGVYGCMNQDAMEVAGLQFGLLDSNSYSTFDGGRGRYVYSARSGILLFTSGPFAGLRRMRITERTFDILDEHGAQTAFVCPWSPKDPRKLHW